MGGKSDSNHAGRIIEFLNKFGIPSEARIASAHKTPGKLMAILAEEEKKGEVGVFITIAGLSNALSGMVEFSTDLPVIACPPPARPSRAPMFFPRSGCPRASRRRQSSTHGTRPFSPPKILALGEPRIAEKIKAFQQEARDKIEADDAGLGAELYPKDAGR
jgi:phosphoribosylaminoimidazole carboxylase PurE protein